MRGDNMELGKDADTGGQVRSPPLKCPPFPGAAPREPDRAAAVQVKYVVELARTLSHHPMVHRVDLLTRLVADPAVDPGYGVAEEQIEAGKGDLGGSYIIRINCGDPKVYLPKERLWPHIRECAPLVPLGCATTGLVFSVCTQRVCAYSSRPTLVLATPFQTARGCRFSDNALAYIGAVQSRLHKANEPCALYAVHGHYADAGEAAAQIAHSLGIPMVLTGHSLGRNKLDHLKRQGGITSEQIEATYQISRCELDPAPSSDPAGLLV